MIRERIKNRFLCVGTIKYTVIMNIIPHIKSGTQFEYIKISGIYEFMRDNAQLKIYEVIIDKIIATGIAKINRNIFI